MNKRILSMLLVLCALIGLLAPTTPKVHAVTESGSCGDHVKWVFDYSTGIFSVNGTGPMTDWSSYWDLPWRSLLSHIKTVEIGSGVTSVGRFSFINSNTIVSVQLPDTLTSIGSYAFGNCPALASITIPNSVTYIGERAFNGCYALESIVIPDSVTTIEKEAFSTCKAVTSVSIGNGVTSIGDFAFQNCYALTDLTLGNGLTTIGYAAFVRCLLLSSVVIPDSVTFIGECAFSGCPELSSITIGDHVTTLRASAFNGTAYYNNPANWTNDVLYLGKYLIEARDSLSGSYSVADGVITIAGGAFACCADLTSVTIPEGVSTIDGGAFSDCHALTTVYIPTTVTLIEMAAFAGCIKLTDIYYAGSKAMWNKILIEDFNYEISMDKLHFAMESPEEPDVPDVPDVAHIPDVPDVPDPTPTIPFADVKAEDYFALPVAWAVENKITNGTTPTTFAPEAGCTRGQIVTFLWRAEGSPEPRSTESPFTDIATTDYYYKAVLWAVEQGITTGTGKGLFSPHKPCTRGQVATFLWRTKGEPAPTIAENPFEDISPAEYYYSAVLWAVENEITNGTGKGLFSPAMECTRGQIVTFLYRAATME